MHQDDKRHRMNMMENGKKKKKEIIEKIKEILKDTRR